MLEVRDPQALYHPGVLVSLLAWESEDVPGLAQGWRYSYMEYVGRGGRKKGKGPHAFVLRLRVKKVKDEEMASSKSKAVDIAEVPLQKPYGRKLPAQAVSHGDL